MGILTETLSRPEQSEGATTTTTTTTIAKTTTVFVRSALLVLLALAASSAAQETTTMSGRLNVLGTALERCSRPGGPVTGFYRDGCCTTGENDFGRHVVCSKMTQMFLAFSRQQGNDLITPAPEYGFPGLKPGDFWCLCASRWAEAFENGVAPPVVLEATDRAALQHVELEDLRAHALSTEPEPEL